MSLYGTRNVLIYQLLTIVNFYVKTFNIHWSSTFELLPQDYYYIKFGILGHNMISWPQWAVCLSSFSFSISSWSLSFSNDRFLSSSSRMVSFLFFLPESCTSFFFAGTSEDAEEEVEGWVSTGSAVSIPPHIPSREGLPSSCYKMESSTGVGLGGLGPPPVFGRFDSDNFPLALCFKLLYCLAASPLVLSIPEPLLLK